MSASSSNMHPTQFVEGLQLPTDMPAEIIRSVIRHFKPRDDDIFIVTYPKCGTTWSHHMLALILRHGEPFGEDFNFLRSSPHLELLSLKEIESRERPCTFQSHLPYHLAPWSDKAKYIHVSRNPKDVCVSFFYHHKNLPLMWFAGEFDEFFEHFISGDISFGDYFDHLQGWYEHRNDQNILFLTYEEMKENPKAVIMKMASFVDDEKYAEPLRKDRQKLENVLKYSSFEEMKFPFTKTMDELFSMSSEDVEKSKVPEGITESISNLRNNNETGGVPLKSSDFVRKGIIGDWRNHFSKEQNQRMDEKFSERIKNIKIAKFWKKYM